MVKRILIKFDPSITYIVKVAYGETIQVVDQDSQRVLKTVRYDDMKSRVERIKVG